MFRHHHLLEHLPETDYVFLVDADMEFQAPVGPEILGDGLTATIHPGFVDMPQMALPFEHRQTSKAYVPMLHRKRYFCGGFIGGTRQAYKQLATGIRTAIDVDIGNDLVAVWHDESHLNHQLALKFKPDIVLSPAYCHPADSSYYEQRLWTQPYERILVAVDKTPAERHQRGG